MHLVPGLHGEEGECRADFTCGFFTGYPSDQGCNWQLLWVDSFKRVSVVQGLENIDSAAQICGWRNGDKT